MPVRPLRLLSVLATLALLVAGIHGQIRERFLIDDLRDPFERTLGENDGFGSAIAALGDLNGDGLEEVAIGAAGDFRDQGAVWIFSLTDARTVARFVKLGPVEGLSFSLHRGDRFGSAVVALGDLDGNGVSELAVGAPGDREGIEPPFVGAGTVWILFLEPDGTVGRHLKLDRLAGLYGELDAGDAFGTALAAPGDLDGNGVPDLLVGAPGDDDGGNNRGAVWILYFADEHSLLSTARISNAAGGMQGALVDREGFGHALALPGDLDGDGIGELAVSSWRSSVPTLVKVRMLFLQGDETVASHVVWNEPLFFSEATALAGTGDLDGDGVEDLAAGRRVALLMASGQPRSLSTIPANEVAALAAPGDLNGDGRPDLIVGMPSRGTRAAGAGGIGFHELFPTSVGPALIVDAASSRLPIAPVGVNGTDPDLYGHCAAPLGDLDEDGLPEIVIGAPRDDDAGTDTGALWVHFVESGSGRRAQKISAMQGNLPLDAGDEFGSAVALLGDLDGNGTNDLAVGAPGDDDGAPNAGAVYVLFLRVNGTVRARQKISLTSGGLVAPATLLRFGARLASLGDVDGDGIVDLAVSSGEAGGSIRVLFLHDDGTVRDQTLIDRALVPGAGTGFGRLLCALGNAGNAAGPALVVGNAGSLFRLRLDRQGQVASSVARGQQNAEALAPVGDLDGDGNADIALIATPAFEIQLLGADFSVASRISLGVPSNWVGLSGLGDVIGDGVADLALGFGVQFSNHSRALLFQLDGMVSWGFEHQDTIDARPLENGRQIPVPHPGRTFVISSGGANLGAAVFDSTPGGPNDPSQDRDLLVDSGKVLMLQDSQVPTQTVPGIFDRPNDDADGGMFAFDFPALVRARSIELADIDGAGPGATVRLIDAASRTRVYDVPAGFTEDRIANGGTGLRKLDLATLAPQPGFAASATASEQAGFDPARVVRVEVELAGSGAVDDLVYDPYP